MESGVSGFVLKDAPVEVLADAIRRCARGEETTNDYGHSYDSRVVPPA
jgi:DNA-binding NarL/FixJ family response regulator